MTPSNQQYITDSHGKRVAIILPIEEYQQILEKAAASLNEAVDVLQSNLEALNPEVLDALYRRLLQLRALRLMDQIQEQAKQAGTDQLSEEEIEAEIQAFRQARSQE